MKTKRWFPAAAIGIAGLTAAGIAGLAVAHQDNGHGWKKRFTPPAHAELDANGDGGVVAEEIHAWGVSRMERWLAEAVARADGDGDGLIDEAEFEALASKRKMRRAFGGKRAQKPAFAVVDADGDGFVTVSEISAIAQGAGDHRAKWVIGRADADGDGALDAAEFAELLEHRGKWGKRGPMRKLLGAPPAFEEIDADGGGRIEAAELNAWFDMRLRSALEERVAAADGDGDGALGPEEVTAFFDEWRHKRRSKKH